MMTVRLAALPAFVIATVLAAPAYAQDAERAADVVVTAQAENATEVDNGGSAGVLGDKPAEDLPFSIRSYDETLILNQQPQTLGQVLENDPTIRTTYGFGNASEQFVVRGFPLFGDDVGLNGLYGIAPRQLVAPELFDSEHKALHRLEERQRVLRRGATLQRENESADELFVLRKGVMMSSVLLDDGSRQILRFLFPGDMIGTASLVYRDAPETLTTLSEATVCPFEKGSFSELTAAHPRLAGLIYVVSQIERVALTDRLASLGRTSAKARVGALLLELRNRQRTTDKSIVDEFTLGLTQEEIGDATGLTAVHVNRMLRQLEDDGMIARTGGKVQLLDDAALAQASNYVDRFEGLDLSWLPAAR